MGRRRRRDKHLPLRVYLHHGAYFFHPKNGPKVLLAHELPEALARYASIVGAQQWSGRTVGDVIDRYRREILPLKRSEQTRDDEGKALDRLKGVFGHMLPENVSTQLCYKYRDERRSKDGKPVPVAARHEISLLGHVFNTAIEWGAATVNPVAGMKRTKRTGKRAQVPRDQVERVRAIADERMRVAIDLAVILGQRRGDLLALRREQLIEGAEGGILFHPSKTRDTNGPVLIQWSDKLRAVIDRAKALPPQVPGEYLIRTRRGKRYSRAGFSAIWQRLMAKHVKAGGQRFSFHDLRSVSADAASSAEEAQARLGHASVETTRRHYLRGVTRAKPAE